MSPSSKPTKTASSSICFLSWKSVFVRKVEQIHIRVIQTELKSKRLSSSPDHKSAASQSLSCWSTPSLRPHQGHWFCSLGPRSIKPHWTRKNRDEHKKILNVEMDSIMSWFHVRLIFKLNQLWLDLYKLWTPISFRIKELPLTMTTPLYLIV